MAQLNTDPANDSATNPNALLTERQARQEIPMSLAWFRRQRLMGGGPPFVRIANRVFYRREDLREFVSQREVR